MKKLFNSDFTYTDEAQELDRNTIAAVENIFDKHTKEGYSPREIEYIMKRAIEIISLGYTV